MHRKFRGEFFTVLALPFLVTMMVVAARYVYAQPGTWDGIAATTIYEIASPIT
jgi:hypothetical protein